MLASTKSEMGVHKEYAKKVTGSNEMDFVKLKIAGECGPVS